MEEALGERVVERNASFVAVVPFWAVWPFEVMILPRRHVKRLRILQRRSEQTSPVSCRR